MKKRNLLVNVALLAMLCGGIGIASSYNMLPSLSHDDISQVSEEKTVIDVTMPATNLRRADNQTSLIDGSLTLSHDLKMNFVYKVGQQETAPSMTVKFVETLETRTIEGTYDESLGGYKYVLDKITPQCVIDEMEISVADQTLTTSVADYLGKVVAENDDEYLKDIAADTLSYAAAAQVKTGHKTDTLASDLLEEFGLTENGNTIDTSSLTSKYLVDGESSADIAWLGGNVVFADSLVLKFRVFIADNWVGWLATTHGLRLTTTIGDNQYVTEKVEFGNPVQEGVSVNGQDGNVYELSVDAITAAQFTSEVTLTFQCYTLDKPDDLYSFGQTLHYSISTYMKNLSDNDLEEADLSLYQAATNYCASAVAYEHKDEIKMQNYTLLVSPTETESGLMGKKYDEFIFEQTEIPSLLEGTTYTQISQLSHQDTVDGPNWINETGILSFNGQNISVSIVSGIKIGDKEFSPYTLQEADSELYSITYNNKEDKYIITFAKDAVIDRGIFVYNSSADLVVDGSLTVSGAAFTEKGRRHTVGDNTEAIEDLEYSLYVGNSNNEKQVVTLKSSSEEKAKVTVDGSARFYGDAVMENVDYQATVHSRNEADVDLQGEIGDVKAEGIKVESPAGQAGSGLTLTNATVDVKTENEISAYDNDKAGLTAGYITAEGSEITVTGFGYGFYLNGKMEAAASTITVASYGRYALAAGGTNLTLKSSTLDIVGDAQYPVASNNTGSPLSNVALTLDKESAATLKIQNSYAGVLAEGASEISISVKDGGYTFDGINAARTLDFTNMSGGTETLKLFTLYNSKGFIDNNPNPCIAKGIYVYTDSEGNITLYDMLFEHWGSGTEKDCLFESGTLNEGLNDGRFSENADLVFATIGNVSFKSNVRFHEPVLSFSYN